MLSINRGISRRASFLASLLIATFVWAQSEGPAFPDPGKVSMSRDQQRAMGLQAAQQVYQQMPVLPDNSPETQYIRALGQKLVATIPSDHTWPFEFHVVAQKEINAFALPGGPMFVNIGTITSAVNEAQLAGVMGHEMSHVYMQHSAKQESKAQKTSMIAELASVALGASGVGNKAGGLVGQLGQEGIQMGAQTLMLKYSRTDESQADNVGTMILYKAGYDPHALADFFETLQQQGGKLPPQFLSDHPNPGNRREAIEKEIANWPQQNFTGDSGAFEKVRQHAMGVKAYTAEEIAAGAKSGQWAQQNQRAGATFNPSGANALMAGSSAGVAQPAHPSATSLESVAPRGGMVEANLGPVTLQHPANWQVEMPEQQGQFVTIAPEAGVTKQGIGYGVLLNGISGQQLQGMSIDQATARIVQQMQQNQGLQLLGKDAPITIGGIQGRSVMLQSVSPIPGPGGQQQKERDWLITVPQRDGSLILFVFVVPEANIGQFRPAFVSMLESVQFH
ncbi:MAG TPA: M48 family metallopeptidase [Terracidiphilus sp.]|nr:M48 family metallopeptidase [Terracidiphilus sp.]